MNDQTDELSRKIAKAKQVRDDSPENLKSTHSESDEEMSFGMRVGVELFAGVAVGLLIGYFLDRVFHTIPLFLIIFVIVGAAAGSWNIYKLAFKDQSDKKPRE